MKNTQLTTNQDRAGRLVFTLLMIASLIIMMLVSSLSCTNKAYYDNDPLLTAGTQDQKERFLECSQNEGDQGCDSCYYLVYGKHIEDYLVNWADDIKNPENEEFVLEVSFNEEIPVNQVTQEQFNKRYEIK